MIAPLCQLYLWAWVTGKLPQPHTAGQRSPALAALDVLLSPERVRCLKPATGHGAASGRAMPEPAAKQPGASAAASPAAIGLSTECVSVHVTNGIAAMRQNSNGGPRNAQLPSGSSRAAVSTAGTQPSSVKTSAVRDSAH